MRAEYDAIADTKVHDAQAGASVVLSNCGDFPPCGRYLCDRALYSKTFSSRVQPIARAVSSSSWNLAARPLEIDSLLAQTPVDERQNHRLQWNRLKAFDLDVRA